MSHSATQWEDAHVLVIRSCDEIPLFEYSLESGTRLKLACWLLVLWFYFQCKLFLLKPIILTSLINEVFFLEFIFWYFSNCWQTWFPSLHTLVFPGFSYLPHWYFCYIWSAFAHCFSEPKHFARKNTYLNKVMDGCIPQLYRSPSWYGILIL